MDLRLPNPADFVGGRRVVQAPALYYCCSGAHRSYTCLLECFYAVFLVVFKDDPFMPRVLCVSCYSVYRIGFNPLFRHHSRALNIQLLVFYDDDWHARLFILSLVLVIIHVRVIDADMRDVVGSSFY